MELSGTLPKSKGTSTNATYDPRDFAEKSQGTSTNVICDEDTPIFSAYDTREPTSETEDTLTNATWYKETPKNATCDQYTPTNASCDPCEFAGETQDAEYYCTVCDEFMCFGCAQSHMKQKATRNHKLLNGDNLPRKRPTLHFKINCSMHEDTPFNYFCNTHNVICCSVCVTLEHRSCDVEYILDHVRTFINGGEYEAILQKLMELEQLVQSMTSKVERNVVTAKCVSDKIEDEMRKLRTEINTKLDILEHNLLERAKTIKNKDTKLLSDLKAELDNIKTDIDVSRTSLEKMYSLKENKQLFIATNLSKTKIISFENKIAELDKQNAVSEYQFCRNEELIRFIDSTVELGSIEEIVNGSDEGNDMPENLSDKKTVLKKQKTVPFVTSPQKQYTCSTTPTTKQTETTTLTTFQHEETQPTTLSSSLHKQTETTPLSTHLKKQPDKRPLNVKHQKDVDINHTREKSSLCEITGTIMLENSRLALVDFGNSSVKILDMTQSTIIHHIQLESRPWDITQTDQGYIVVTAPFIQSLIFITFRGFFWKALTVDRKLKVGGECHGIDYGNDMLVVSCTNPGLLKLIKTDGQTIRTIRTDANGKFIFSCPRYVAFSADRQSLYISDYNEESIKHLDMNGTVLGVYTSNYLMEPSRVTVDRHNNVYIAGYYSNLICVLASGSTQVQPVVNVFRPKSVLVCDDSYEMFVGGITGQLHVYKMQ